MFIKILALLVSPAPLVHSEAAHSALMWKNYLLFAGDRAEAHDEKHLQMKESRRFAKGLGFRGLRF